MMNKALPKIADIPLARVLLGVVAISLLSFLYVKTQSFDHVQHNKIVANLSQFKQLDATLNQDVIRSRSGLLRNYDPLVHSLTQLHALADSFIAGPHSIYQQGQAHIDEYLATQIELLAQKEAAVERFKSHNAILNNSLRYFPIAAHEFIEIIRAQGNDEQAVTRVSTLLADIYIYNVNASEELSQQINNDLDDLANLRNRASDEMRSSLDILTSHAHTILTQKKEVDELLAGIILMPSGQTADKLFKAYQNYAQQNFLGTNIYRFYLYLFAVLLLAYIVHILLRLRHTRDALQQDIIERLHAEAALFTEKERAQVTLESIGDAVITTDTLGRVEYLNPVAESLTGWDTAEARGLPLKQVFHIINETTREVIDNPVQLVLETGQVVGLGSHTALVRRDGSQFSIEDSAAPIRNREGKVTGVVLVFHDVSDSRKMASQLTHQASHDPLTSLINRREFERRLDRALTSPGKQHALLYIDLDQFKIVNDTCGHIAGDELLRQISHLLQTRLRERDTLARLGGDEFGVLLEHCPPELALRIAEELRQIVNDFHFIWQHKAFTVGASIGLVSFNDGSLSLNEILSAADTACYLAKDKGRNRIHIYYPEDSELAIRHGEMEWVGRIHKAFEENRFRLYSQDIVSLSPHNKTTTYQELLLRMLDEQGNLVTPMAFIPAAERYNLMPTIDRWVIRTALSQYARLYTLQPGHVEIGIPSIKNQLKNNTGEHIWIINLSGASLGDEHFLGFVREQFLRTSVPHHMICFEITETAAITNLTKAQHFISELKMLGCRFSLDDFGSGLSSFSYLKHLSVDFLKIDGSFVRDMTHDPIDYAMVEAIHNIGHVMRIKTIAESVENNETLILLKQIGVNFAQGYAIAKPKPLYAVTQQPLECQI